MDIERAFAVFADHAGVTRLRVKKLRPGMQIEVRCRRKKCPKALRKGKVKCVNVKKSGTRSFTKFSKRRGRSRRP